MGSTGRQRVVLMIGLMLALLAGACGSGVEPAEDGAGPTTSESVSVATDAGPVISETETEDGGDSPETVDPAPPSRRTSLEDVLVDPTGPTGVPEGFSPSAVAVDAWPVARVLVDSDEATVATAIAEFEAGLAEGEIVVRGQALGCVLMVAWVLPEPTQVTMGVEFHPTIACVRASEFDILAVIPASGENSEGEWNYDGPPEVVLSPRIGTFDD